MLYDLLAAQGENPLPVQATEPTEPSATGFVACASTTSKPGRALSDTTAPSFARVSATMVTIAGLVAICVVVFSRQDVTEDERARVESDTEALAEVDRLRSVRALLGDVEPQAVLELAKKYFGPLKPEVMVPPKPRIEPPQKGKRELTVQAPAEVPYTVMGYKTPVLATAAEGWEPYALEVLANTDLNFYRVRLTTGNGIPVEVTAV